MGGTARWFLVVFSMCLAAAGHTQNRGVYPLGLSAINSGVSATPGLTYNNSFLFYARDKQVDGNGEVSCDRTAGISAVFESKCRRL